MSGFSWDRWVKRALVVKAICIGDIPAGVPLPEGCRWVVSSDGNINGLAVETLEGKMTGGLEDYLVCGTKGEFYPVKYDIFAECYERAPVAPRG